MYPSSRLFAALYKIRCGGISACLVTSEAYKVCALQSHICTSAIGFAQKSLANAFRPVSSSLNFMIKQYISCIGGVLRAGPASASVTVISRSLANTLVSLPVGVPFVSQQIVRCHVENNSIAKTHRDGLLNRAPSPCGPFGNLKINGIRSRVCLDLIQNNGDEQDQCELINVGYGKALIISISTAGGTEEQEVEVIGRHNQIFLKAASNKLKKKEEVKKLKHR
ncbi:MAG: hypothetical protein EZS28_037634 [Streblomastix strix]|uniref:Uncharacterized protein n=1 Tax=Streblomastix strix TaxID=222440 RepID=A0A5J4U9F9_9EUKA|nr:MAG: hypothetical protein EZS28_037634 [Streblomastix strix]